MFLFDTDIVDVYKKRDVRFCIFMMGLFELIQFKYLVKFGLMFYRRYLEYHTTTRRYCFVDYQAYNPTGSQATKGDLVLGLQICLSLVS